MTSCTEELGNEELANPSMTKQTVQHPSQAKATALPAANGTESSVAPGSEGRKKTSTGET